MDDEKTEIIPGRKTLLGNAQPLPSRTPSETARRSGVISGLMLLVDDDPVALSTGRIALSARGYQIVTAGSAREAIALQRETSFEIVVSAMTMKDIDGFGLLEMMREAQLDTPLIFTNASLPIDLKQRALRQGVLKVIKKPINVDKLQTSIGIAVALHRIQTECKTLAHLSAPARRLVPVVPVPIFDRSISGIWGVSFQLNTFPSRTRQIDPRVFEFIGQTISHLPEAMKIVVPITAQDLQDEENPLMLFDGPLAPYAKRIFLRLEVDEHAPSGIDLAGMMGVPRSNGFRLLLAGLGERLDSVYHFMLAEPDAIAISLSRYRAHATEHEPLLTLVAQHSRDTERPLIVDDVSNQLDVKMLDRLKISLMSGPFIMARLLSMSGS